MTAALIGVAGWLRGLLGALLGIAPRHPWQAACLALLALAAWQYSGKRTALQQLAVARAAIAQAKEDRQADRAEWNRNVALAKAATAAAERKSREIATHAQVAYDALAADHAGLRRYIDARRLRAEGSAATAPSAAERDSSALPADASGSALVAADEADLAACDRAYVYAASAYAWGQELIAAGLGRLER